MGKQTACDRCGALRKGPPWALLKIQRLGEQTYERSSALAQLQAQQQSSNMAFGMPMPVSPIVIPGPEKPWVVVQDESYDLCLPCTDDMAQALNKHWAKKAAKAKK